MIRVALFLFHTSATHTAFRTLLQEVLCVNSFLTFLRGVAILIEMPRKQPMPPEEMAICDRLKQFRSFLGLTQAEFAALAGLNPLAYASYEYRKSQLNYPAAWRILTTFRQLNPRWLAGDHRQMWDIHFVAYPSPDELEHGPRTAFSEVYERDLKHRLLLGKSAFLSNIDKAFPLFRLTPDAAGRLAGKEIFGHLMLDWLAYIPEKNLNKFLDELLRSAVELLKKYQPEGDSKLSVAMWKQMIQFESRAAVGAMNFKPSEESNLTNAETSEKLSTVQAQLPDLLERLKKATSATGKKTELAGVLKAPLASVSRWLSGEREPGGEIALQMDDWATRQGYPRRPSKQK